MACVHGYSPGECMICRTLEPAPSGKQTKTRRRDKRAAGDAARPPVAVVDHAPHEREGRGGRTAVHVVVLLAVLAIAAVSVLLVTSLVFAIFHLIELVLVAGVAATLGYRIGRSRGRRER